jgi:S-disulfanyl-L-cysteine oxidoreductase SoxD
MRGTRWSVLGWTALVVGCASAAATNVRPPLGARLTPGAKTGPTIPLRVDPNARVILSSAAGLPPASYLPSQAARGEKVYAETCGQCHQPAQLIGQNFVESWNDRRVYDFYALVRGTMPLDNPGGLKEQEYIDVVAYLLQANKAPPGPDSLRADTTALRAHKIAVRNP